MRLGWLTGLGFLVVLLLSVLQLGMTQAGSVAILILAVLSFLGGFFFVVFLTGFQCPRCNRLYFIIGFRPDPMRVLGARTVDCLGISCLRTIRAKKAVHLTTVVVTLDVRYGNESVE